MDRIIITQAKACSNCGAAFSDSPLCVRCPRCRPRQLSTEERFWRKVNKRGSVVRADLGPCWEWTGATTSFGYGVFWVPERRKLVGAHRFSLEITTGHIPKGARVLHACDNPPCVRHLFLGTQSDNMRDMADKGRWALNGPRSLPRGTNNHKSKLTEADVRAMRSAYTRGAPGRARENSLSDLADRYGVTVSNVHAIVQRRTWKHVE